MCQLEAIVAEAAANLPRKPAPVPARACRDTVPRREVEERARSPFTGVPLPKCSNNQLLYVAFPRGYALVTQNLTRGDPVWYTPEGLAAVEKEVSMLLRSQAFSFDEVLEEARVAT